MSRSELDVNLGKLVHVGIHGRLKNSKIAKIYFLMLEWGVFYTVEKLMRRTFQQAKENTNRLPC